MSLNNKDVATAKGRTIKKARILVIDDEPSYRELLSFELGSQGYEVVTAGMATEGFMRMKEQNVDLLISDVRMPGEMDGIDMVQMLRKSKPYLRVIFITGYAIEEKLQSALKQQFTKVLRKPFELDELLNAVREFLEKK